MERYAEQKSENRVKFRLHEHVVQHPDQRVASFEAGAEIDAVASHFGHVDETDAEYGKTADDVNEFDSFG